MDRRRLRIIASVLVCLVALSIAGVRWWQVLRADQERRLVAQVAARAEQASQRKEAVSLVHLVGDLRSLAERTRGVKDSLEQKAATNETALAERDAKWQRLDAAYRQAVKDVETRNAAEKAKQDASRPASGSGTSSAPTYIARYRSPPAAPAALSSVTATIGEEIKRIAEIRSASASLASDVSSAAATAAWFKDAYGELTPVQRELEGALDRLDALMETLITHSDKGDVIDGRSVASVDLTGLDAKLDALDRIVGSALGARGLDPNDLPAR